MLSKEDYKKLYFNFEIARRANIREDRKLIQECGRLKKGYDLVLLKQDLDFQAEKSKQLDLEEAKLAAEISLENEINERENRRKERTLGLGLGALGYDNLSLPSIARKTQIEDFLKQPKTNWHGYISEPGSNFKASKMTSTKIKDNDIVKKQFAVTDNWMREENLQVQKQQKRCRKLLKVERIHKKVAEKKMDQFVGTGQMGDWIERLLEESDNLEGMTAGKRLNLNEEESAKAKDSSAGASQKRPQSVSLSDISDSNESIESKTESEKDRTRSLNAIRDNFLRLFFKYDSKNQKQDISNYVKYQDAPPKNFSRRASLGFVGQYNNLMELGSRRGSMLIQSNSLSRKNSFHQSRSSQKSRSSSVSGHNLAEIELQIKENEDREKEGYAPTYGEGQINEGLDLERPGHQRGQSLPDINFAIARRTRYLRWPDHPKFERELTFERILE